MRKEVCKRCLNHLNSVRIKSKIHYPEIDYVIKTFELEIYENRKSHPGTIEKRKKNG